MFREHNCCCIAQEIGAELAATFKREEEKRKENIKHFEVSMQLTL